MSAFRLARLLALREDQAQTEKIRWAQAQRVAVEADAARTAGRERVRRAYTELGASRDAQGELPRAGQDFRSTIAAYETLDAMHARSVLDDEALATARQAAVDARAPYDLRRRDVEALRRLEERFKKERRRKRRQRENREREAFINGRFGSSGAAPGTSRTTNRSTHPSTTPSASQPSVSQGPNR